MNQSDIDRIKTYIAAATPGPWRFALAYKKEHYGPLVAAVAPGHHIQAENCSGGTYPNRDAEFIAQARTDLPAAIAEIERLSAENDGHVKEIARLIKVHEPRYHELLSLRAENAHLKSQLEQAKAFRDIGRGLET